MIRSMGFTYYIHEVEIYMKRIPSLLITPGIALFLIGITLILLVPKNSNHVARAALPDGHPSLYPALEGTAILTSTIHDFFLPGTQPNQITETIIEPLSCTFCHDEGYSQPPGDVPPTQPRETETWTAWSGSMMAQSGRDPLFYAALDIANADANQSGEFCLRCHIPRGWLEGRSSTVDGSAMTADDLEGVQCEVCHRMVDPVYTGENPERDIEVHAAITSPVSTVGNAAIIVDTADYRRGPLLITEVVGFDPHETIGTQQTLQSPFHEESAFCGSCHDIDNPLFSWDAGRQSYWPNEMGVPADPTDMFPVERTYSEWLLSEYNSAEGIYAPELGGNRDYVSSCQDCHMRAITGIGGIWPGGTIQETRDDYPLHDLTGANTWVPQIIPLHPVFSATFTTGPQAEERAAALITGTERARYMLQNAADMTLVRNGNQLEVTIINQSGHKLPTGYVEGRRMWIQVEGYDIDHNLVYTSGLYDVASATLFVDPDLMVYEAKPGLTNDWATQIGLPAGPSFHFVLNNVMIKDNRIPPRGYAYDAFNAAGAAPYTNGQPDPTRYADGQYWDTVVYTLPTGVVSGTVRLVHQIASREYIEFLRDNNPNSSDPNNNGQILYELWEMTEKSRPEVMVEMNFYVDTTFMYIPTILRK